MRKLVRSVLALCLIQAANLATAQTWPWAIKSTGSSAETGISISADASNNSYAVGNYVSGTNCIWGTNTLVTIGNTDGYLVKLNSAGAVQWAVSMGGALDDSPKEVVTNGSDVYITGYHRGNITFNTTSGGAVVLTTTTTAQSSYIVKYNSSGVPQWAFTYGGGAITEPWDIAINNSLQRIYISGTTGNNLMELCYNFSGALQWSITSSGSNTNAMAVTADASGNSYVLASYMTGTVTLPAVSPIVGNMGMILMKVAPTGTITWANNIGASTSGDESGRGIGLDASGNIYIGGQAFNNANISGISLTNPNGTFMDLFVAKYNNSGTVQWARRVGGNGGDYMNGFETTTDGNSYVLAGNQENNSVGIGCKTFPSVFGNTDNKFYVMKMSDLGQVRGGAAPVCNNNGIFPGSICLDASNDLFITGQNTGTVSYGSNVIAGTGDAFVTRVSITNELPTISNQTICVGSSASLAPSAPTGGGFTFKWYNAASGGTNIFNGTPYITSTFAAPTTTTYYVSASYTTGCESERVPVTVTVLSYTNLTASADQTICPGTCATITFSGTTNGILYPGAIPVTSPFTVCPVATTNYTLLPPGSFCITGDAVKITVATPLPFLGTYSASVFNPGSCMPAMTSTSKDISLTANITAPMPTGANLATFRCAIGSTTAIGWLGAGSVGVNNLTFTSTYTVDVYEVNSSGVRLAGAPSVFLIIGTGPSVGDINFNAGGNGAGFDPANSPYFVDATAPADPAGITGAGDYFKSYYLEAKANGTLTAFSAKIFCVDLQQTTADGCSVAKKSFFRIASASFNGSQNAKQATGAEGPDEGLEFITAWEVYPNPSAGVFNIKLESVTGNEQIQVLDYTGKLIRTLKSVGVEQKLDLSGLAKGIYFIKLNGEGVSDTRKVVLE